MIRKLILFWLFYTVHSKCPAPFPGEHGPCMKTCGPTKHCSPGLWCCITPCGGTVCKIPELANQIRPSRHYRENANPLVPSTLKIPPIERHHFPAPHQQPSLMEDQLLSQIQNEIFQILQPEPALVSNQPFPTFSIHNHGANIAKQHQFNIFQPPPTTGHVMDMSSSCSSDRPRIFCGYDPCHGQSCPLFPGSVCIPDYCGDCKHKYTLATVDVTKYCHYKL